ncbi:MAG: hypothetical protein NZM12_03165 [Steroidobacteraceae bacterium]|nr:hypothetical protein [Steroidobacteraceae bacterium]MDW8258334.1 hypothetical protein [Gammaproteobacteria bacterium]
MSVKVVFALNGPASSVPDAGRAPLQPPDAVHEVAFVVVQLRLVEPPRFTLPGVAVRLTVGGGVDCTTTVTEALAFALPFVHCSVNVVVELSIPVTSLPLVGFAPLQPPEAVQEVAFVLVQFSVADRPGAGNVDGFAVSVTVGVGFVTVTVTDACALPPGPLQLSVKLVLAVRLPVLALPLVGCAPLQPPDAVQEVAFELLQVSWLAPPEFTEVGLAVSCTVGAGGDVPPLLPPPPPPQADRRPSTAAHTASARKCLKPRAIDADSVAFTDR